VYGTIGCKLNRVVELHYAQWSLSRLVCMWSLRVHDEVLVCQSCGTTLTRVSFCLVQVIGIMGFVIGGEWLK
jgi:hypothetical protein